MSNAGRVWPSETSVEQDPISRIPVRRLTAHLGHSHHLYFTNPGWYDRGQRLLFGSERENAVNLFSVRLATGEITQLTDFPPERDYPPALSFLHTSVNPRRDEAYFWKGNDLLALDLRTQSLKSIYALDPHFRPTNTSVSSDGKVVCVGAHEDLSAKFKVNLLYGYVGFREYFDAHPVSRVIEIATDGSASHVLWEENNWIGHVNTSPTQPNLLTFCHEGPWNRVDNRIWGLDRSTRDGWKIRPTEPGEYVGHEYWLADGVHIGFHGKTLRGNGQPIFGWIKWDNTEHAEAPFPQASMHFHSNSTDLVIGDGSASDSNVYLWAFRDGRFTPRRVLCQHRSSFHIQQTHVHPRLSPDGRRAIFTSDALGYGNLYMVDLPPFDSLPPGA